ncbi:MAG TPA: undecaprenyl diphosphate synthase family protein, partial [Spirochaetia bacterium]|nr:undecaprenyl diphosphate synthase family protein [Spirochaetia bacterium]
IQVQNDTAGFGGLTVNLAINYGGQDEILRAVKRWQADPDRVDLDTEGFQRYLDRPEMPPVDFLVRTAGEVRLSNFLLWESAYAEFHFSEKLWPDWTEEDLRLALREFQKRQRKFGGVHE